MKATMLKRNNKTKNFKEAIVAGDYQPNYDLGMAKRAAECLAWAAESYPGEVIPFNLLYRSCLGQKRTPDIKSKEVQAFMGRTADIRRELIAKHGRDLLSVRGLGVRASYSDDDLVENRHQLYRNRVAAANRSLATFSSIVNVQNLSSDNKSIMADVNYCSKHIESGDFKRRLLPPRKDA